MQFEEEKKSFPKRGKLEVRCAISQYITEPSNNCESYVKSMIHQERPVWIVQPGSFEVM